MEYVIKKGDRNMAANVQLDITWDGPVSGLAEHRLSLHVFGPALNQLLMAVQRIASNIVMNAVEPSETGRLAKAAHGLDIQLSGVVQGSSGVATCLTFDAPVSFQPDLFYSLPERTGIELMDAIEAESRSEYRNIGVRNFLKLLPPSLTRQHYKLHENGRIIRELPLGQVHLPEGMLALPYLEEIVGMVSGVGFEPGRTEVRLKPDDAAQVVAVALPTQVDKALDMRREKVRALLLQTQVGAKLLTLEDNESKRSALSEEEYIFARWDNAFQELA